MGGLAATRGVTAGRSAMLILRASGAFVHAAWLRWDRWRPEMILDDLRYALRALAARPGFVAVAVLTLALGIGANAVVFSAVHAVLYRPLPFGDGVVRLFQADARDQRRSEASAPDFVDWREGSRRLAGMAAYTPTSLALTADGDPEQLSATTVTGDFFRVLGITAAYGRTLLPEDDPVTAPAVVVLSHGLWTRRYGAQPSVIGRTIVLDGQPHAVIGVLPQGASFPRDGDVWVPLRFTADQLATQRGAHYLDVVGRLAPATALADAAAELQAIGTRLAVAYPSTNRGTSVAVVPFRDALVGDVRPALLVLLGAVGLVLLIACVNVANLLLTRALGRTRELAVRAALGADRARIVRALFVESLVVAGLGAAGGLLVASWAASAVIALEPVTGIPLLDTVTVDRAVLMFCAGLAVATALLFGVLPALQATRRIDVGRVLQGEGRTATGDRARSRVRSVLIVAQTTMAVVLLVGAGLLVRSFERLVAVNLGFEPRGILTYAVSLPEATYTTPASRAAAVETLLDRVRTLPGSRGAAAVFGLPLTDFSYGITTRAIEVPRSGCSSTIGGSGGDWRRCWGTIGAVSSWRSACSSRCRARR